MTYSNEEEISLRGLLHRVPKAPGYEIPEGANDEDFDLFGSTTGLLIPAELRKWLCLSNGAQVGPGGFYGIGSARDESKMESVFNIFVDWIGKGWFPVAGDGCGNFYVMLTKYEYGNGYPIVFVDCEVAVHRPSFIVASKLPIFVREYLRQDIEKTNWPFDKCETLKIDPDLASYRGIQFPWGSI